MKDAIEDLKDERIKEIVEASEDPEETIRQLSEQLSQRHKQLEKEYWERCRFCKCGAESVMECSCDKDKKQRYIDRTNRKINKDLGHTTGFTIAALRQEYGV